MHFGASLGEDGQERENVQSIGVNESIPLNNLMERDALSLPNLVGVVQDLALPPPPPAVFLGYTLPPGHPCNAFTLPPPPADRKRTGPRRKFYIFFLKL